MSWGWCSQGRFTLHTIVPITFRSQHSQSQAHLDSRVWVGLIESSDHIIPPFRACCDTTLWQRYLSGFVELVGTYTYLPTEYCCFTGSRLLPIIPQPPEYLSPYLLRVRRIVDVDTDIFEVSILRTFPLSQNILMVPEDIFQSIESSEFNRDDLNKIYWSKCFPCISKDWYRLLGKSWLSRFISIHFQRVEKNLPPKSQETSLP